MTFLTFIVLAVTPAAFAQFELGVDGSYMVFNSDLIDDEGERISFHAAYYFSEWFALEGQISHAEADSLDTEHQTYSLNGVVSFRHDEVVQPYFMGGFGWVEAERDLIGGGMIEDDGQATVGAIGTKIFFGDQETFGLRLESGFVWDDLFGDSKTHISWSAGFIWRLGS
ncbi:MAG: outer membrane beta-barrel protein [Thermoanaerobaculia bacterium]|nr:outer membrane beta-barrel protein [Thermoanaerobaculia bacterium]